MTANFSRLALSLFKSSSITRALSTIKAKAFWEFSNVISSISQSLGYITLLAIQHQRIQQKFE